VRLRIESEDPSQAVHILVGVNRVADDLQCFSVATRDDGVPPLSGAAQYDVRLHLLDVPLLRGDYSVIAFAGDENAMTVFDRKDLRPGFSIAGDRWEVGLIGIRHRWERAGVERQAAAPAVK
jgi:hypothetical protein